MEQKYLIRVPTTHRPTTTTTALAHINHCEIVLIILGQTNDSECSGGHSKGCCAQINHWLPSCTSTYAFWVKCRSRWLPRQRPPLRLAWAQKACSAAVVCRRTWHCHGTRARVEASLSVRWEFATCRRRRLRSVCGGDWSAAPSGRPSCATRDWWRRPAWIMNGQRVSAAWHGINFTLQMAIQSRVW